MTFSTTSDKSTLNGAISSDTQLIELVPSRSVPSCRGLVLQIESELVLVEDSKGELYTVRRGYNGTTHAAHADASVVTVMAQDDEPRSIDYSGLESSPGLSLTFDPVSGAVKANGEELATAATATSGAPIPVQDDFTYVSPAAKEFQTSAAPHGEVIQAVVMGGLSLAKADWSASVPDDDGLITVTISGAEDGATVSLHYLAAQ